MLVKIEKAAELTGLSKYELMRGAKEGKYPYVRIGKGKTAPYMFDIELLQEILRGACLKNADEQKKQIEQEDIFRFVVPRIRE